MVEEQACLVWGHSTYFDLKSDTGYVGTFLDFRATLVYIFCDFD